VGADSGALGEEVASLGYLGGLLWLRVLLDLYLGLASGDGGLVTNCRSLNSTGEDRLDVEQMRKVLALQVVPSGL